MLSSALKGQVRRVYRMGLQPRDEEQRTTLCQIFRQQRQCSSPRSPVEDLLLGFDVTMDWVTGQPHVTVCMREVGRLPVVTTGQCDSEDRTRLLTQYLGPQGLAVGVCSRPRLALQKKKKKDTEAVYDLVFDATETLSPYHHDQIQFLGLLLRNASRSSHESSSVGGEGAVGELARRRRQIAVHLLSVRL